MIILVGGQKGGCGKTNVSTNIAAYLAGQGRDLIVVDTDSRQNSSSKWAARRSMASVEPFVNCTGIYDDIRPSVQDFSKRYELVIIDAGGRDSKEFRTGLLVSDICLTPFVPSQHDIDTLPLVDDLIEQTAEFNPKIRAVACFSNCPQNVGAREKRIKKYREALGEELNNIKLLETEIINRISYTDTAGTGKGVTETSDSKAAEEIMNLVREVGI